MNRKGARVPLLLALSALFIAGVGVSYARSYRAPIAVSHEKLAWVSQVGDGLVGPACASSACTSAPNSCGMTASGTYDPDHQTSAACTAVTPSNSLCDCNASTPQCLVPAPPAANPVAIFPGGSVTLNWNCPAASFSSSQGNGFSTGGALTGSVAVKPSTSTTYSVQCVAPSGSGGGAPTGSVAVTVVQSDLSITSSSARVNSGDSVTVTWSATGITANSCAVTANSLPIRWTGDSGSQQATITAQTIFTLSCSTAAGSVSKSTTVNLVPSFQEI